MDRTPISPPREEHSAVPRNRINPISSAGGVENWLSRRLVGWLPALILELGEALLLSWWLLWLTDLGRPGMVSTRWNLNWLLGSALALVLLGLILGAKTGRVNSLVAIISGILITLTIWQALGDSPVILLAPIGGLIVFILFKYQHD